MTASAGPRPLENRPVGGVGAWSPWAWVALSSVGFVVAPFVAVALLSPLAALPGVAQLALPIAWTLIASAGVLAAGRAAFAAWPVVTAEATILLATGAAFAGATHGALHAWAGYRYGYYDPELIGPTAAFPFVVVGVAVAAFAGIVAPRGASLPPLIVAAVGIALSVMVLGGNLPGLADGLAPESIAPALVIAGASVYVAVAAGVAAWARWRPTEAGR